MIRDADEFVRLRCSEDPEEYRRAVREPADEATWREVIERFPDMRKWVAHNKTVPLPILVILSTDENPEVRGAVATKRNLSPELLARLAADSDSGVRMSVINNANTPLDILTAMARSDDAWTADRAKERLVARGHGAKRK